MRERKYVAPGELQHDPEGYTGPWPEFRITEHSPYTHGALYEGFPCGKCGCQFVNVGIPKQWPSNTVALTCAKCGSVVTYVDGWLMLTPKKVFLKSRGKWVVRHKIATELQPREEDILDAAKRMVRIAKDLGMSIAEIAEQVGMTEHNVQVILQASK